MKVDDGMTKESIIIAALRLFLTQGYKSVSLIDVANEIGITKGGIYHYFSSKDELLQAAFHFLLDSFEVKYKDLLNSTVSLKDILQILLVENALEKHATELLGVDHTCRIDHIHFAIDIVRRFPNIQERIQENRKILFNELAKKIQQAITDGEVREDMDENALAAIFIALLNGHKSLDAGFTSEKAQQQMVNTLWNLIRM